MVGFVSSGWIDRFRSDPRLVPRRCRVVVAVRECVVETNTVRGLRGQDWTFGSDVLKTSDGSHPNVPVVVCIHTATGLGVNRTYWRPLFRLLQGDEALLRGFEVRSFDWIGTGDAGPKPDFVDTPYTSDDYMEQLVSYVSGLGGRMVILVAQGASEPIALRMAAQHGDLLSGMLLSNGVSTKYVTTRGEQWKKNLSYSILKSPAGNIFWDFCATYNYIEGFSRKNILLGENAMHEWVSLAVDGAQDRRVRFGVFSFISGFLFGDFTDDMRRIDLPCMFLAGGQVPNPTARSKMQSARPPVPIQVQEGSFRENRLERLEHRKSMIKHCTGEVVTDAGPEMWFESPALCLPPLERFVKTLEAARHQ